MTIGKLDNKGGPLTNVGDRSTNGLEGKKGAARSSTGAATPAHASEPSAKVELSRAATSLGKSSGEFDAEKVERIASAIREGRYHVNAEAIADKLISNAKELLGRTPRS